MRFLIVTGQSGAGKSRTASTLEDLGFYCVDNLPLELIGQFAEICLATTGRFEKVALVSDVRAGQSFTGLLDAMDALDAKGIQYSIVYVEASAEVIMHRYKETRRSHPLSKDGTPLQDAVLKEKQMLARVRERADYIIDTSTLSTAGLRSELIRLFEGELPQRAMVVNVQSFGFKYGLPMDADLVFDVRFLPNPFYIEELKKLTGNDKPVSDYVLSFPQTGEFRKKLADMIRFLIPYYVEEGKNQLVIAIGCTGGQHRSVTIANCLYEDLKGGGDYALKIYHRDAL